MSDRILPAPSIHRRVLAGCLLVIVLAAQGGGVARAGGSEHTEIVTTPTATYTIDVEGALDAEITRTDQDYELPWIETFQPNRFLSIENLGYESIAAPWVSVDGRGDWIDVEGLLADVITPGMNDAEKGLALWAFVNRNQYRLAQSWGVAEVDPVVAMNTYGYSECVGTASLLGRLARAAGLEARLFGSDEHTITEIFWNGKPHLLDADRAMFASPRPGLDLVSAAELIVDHHVGRWTHAGWTGSMDSPGRYIYLTEPWDVVCQPDTLTTPAARDMRFRLRPAEIFHRSWEPGTRFSSYHFGPVSHGVPPARFANGYLRYAPALRDTIFREGMDELTALRSFAEDGLEPAVHVESPGGVGRMVLRMESPYVIVGGSVTLAWQRHAATDVLDLDVSRDGVSWDPLWSATDLGTGVVSVNLDDWIAPHDRPRLFTFWIAVDLDAGDGNPVTSVGLDSLNVTADFQVSPSSLPALRAGTNHVTYRDEHAGNRLVRIVHGWESVSGSPPVAPLALYPLPGATPVSLRPEFRWQAPADPDGDAISDYQIQVSERADFRWPVSPNFDRYLSCTSYAGGTRWIPRFNGLLAPGASYYWRVRAQDSGGAWGDWSEPVLFQASGVAAPESLAGVPHGQELRLTWRTEGSTTRPRSFEVYGDDEQGFTPWAGNFLATVADSSCVVRTPFPFSAAQNRAFYRVVAVDSAGVRSAVSACIELPHPVVTTLPPVRAVSGTAYNYVPGISTVTRYDRVPHQDVTAAFLEEHPAWLQVTGNDTIRGTPGPEDAGVWPVRLRVEDGHGGEITQQFVVRSADADQFTESIVLAPGYNLVSWPIRTGESTADELLGGIDENLVRILSVDDGEPVRDPHALHPGNAYWFQIRETDTLSLTGDIVEPALEDIPVTAGWNLVPFLPFAPDSVEHALASLGTNLRAVMGVGASGGVEVFDPALQSHSTLSLLVPGHGYWLETGSDDTLRFPTSTVHPVELSSRGGRIAVEPVESTPQSWRWAAMYADELLDGSEPAPIGTLIEVYDSDGVMCGSTVLETAGAFPFIAIWEDDPHTTEDEGAEVGDQLTLMVGGKPLTTRPIFPGLGARIAAGGTLGPPPDGGDVATLRFASPVRFGDDLRFFVLLARSGEVSLDLYEATGRHVRGLTAHCLAGIETAIRWDGRDSKGHPMAPAMYFVSLRHPGGRIDRKFLVLR